MALPVDVTDPGLVNVESQAYPFPPGGFQNLPPNFGRLLQASLFAAPIVPPSIQAGLIPSAITVGDQPFVSLPLSQGAAALTPAEIDLEAQNLIRQPVHDFIVTDVGNFDLTQANSNIRLTVTSVVDADTGGAVGANTTRIRIFVSGAILTDLGLSILFRQVIFIGNTSPLIAGRPRTINAYGANSIIVDRTQFGTTLSTIQPAVGDLMDLNIDREGSEVVFDVFASPANVFIDPSPPIAQTASAPQMGYQGNVFIPQTGSSFVGAGINGPSFQGTFEVANQTYGNGLPGNIFP